MGTIYNLINVNRKERIILSCKYGESVGHAKFITWLSFEWNQENWYWVHDSNSFSFPELYYEFKDMTKSYQNAFKDSFWFNDQEKSPE